MIHIDKGPEPRELMEHRASSPDATYADFRGSDALRTALVTEQGHVCAYCMQRIKATSSGMKIEHWYPQHPSPIEPDPERSLPTPRGPLDFHNLLGVCTGGERSGQRCPEAEQHCDTKKGNRLLTIDPLDHPERLLRYGTDGTIRSTDTKVQAELDDVLNLNLERLRYNRKSAWDGVYAALKQGGAASFRPNALGRKLERIRNPGPGVRRLEYCGYVTFFLDKKLRGAS